ncbi:ATP-binding protein [Actinomadura rupiterrae]|uniref:ATP-binding protein n=1 Tax=Actinomadura rupiterrae TaxID=559627 RepID=UPI0020A50672|nr:ATP-binding protein [Actinomadura rupiterrae]MCP2341962.1 anti-sigma regulatory factor (Ser/Thr protein kinase) [Actinomadura rupiterrae]
MPVAARLAAEPWSVPSGPWTARVWRLHPARAERRAREIVRELLERAGTAAGAVDDLELVAAELAANGVQHAEPPLELRVLFAGSSRRPIWCEIADADPFLGRVPELLRPPPVLDADDLDALIDGLGEDGRGLSMVHELTAGRCAAYPTTTCSRPGLGKAIGFSLL